MVFWCSFSLCPSNISDAAEKSPIRYGVWVTVFSPEKVLYSKENADRLISTCKKTNIQDIYVQVYRAGKAYYNSSITDSTPYNNVLSGSGEDILKYLIARAKENDINIYAWLNLLSIAQNINADIVQDFGKSVLVVDQHGRTSMQEGRKDDLDTHYIRENQLFIEPGDWRVRKHLTDIAAEVITRYPDLAGLHLDYIRYPAAVPFIPGSRFTSHGISYGYSAVNTKNFKDATGLDIKTMKYSRKNYRLWDDWRRQQVTDLVRNISRKAKEISPEIEISCTIVPSIERTYLVTFQNWTKWLREGLVDYVVAMNYTDDTSLMELNSTSLFMPGLEDKVQIGVGAYLLKEKPNILKDQINILRRISPAGIVFFSYDEIAANADLQNFLATN